MNISVEDPFVQEGIGERRRAVPKKRMKVALLSAIIGVGAIAVGTFDGGDPPTSPQAPSTAEPTADPRVPWVETFPGCLNDIECYGQ